MAHVLRIYADTPLRLNAGPLYVAQASGRERADGTWEGWLEFVPDDGSDVLRSQRETTQPNLGALTYWASGLTPVYLTGALERTLTPPTVSTGRPVIPSVYDAPEPVLDPFSAYAKGETLLRRQLAALSPRHLRDILVGYELVDSTIDLGALTMAESIELIVAAVRSRLAA
jgi:hypothetical protein